MKYNSITFKIWHKVCDEYQADTIQSEIQDKVWRKIWIDIQIRVMDELLWAHEGI